MAVDFGKHYVILRDILYIAAVVLLSVVLSQVYVAVKMGRAPSKVFSLDYIVAFAHFNC